MDVAIRDLSNPYQEVFVPQYIAEHFSKVRGNLSDLLDYNVVKKVLTPEDQSFLVLFNDLFNHLLEKNKPIPNSLSTGFWRMDNDNYYTNTIQLLINTSEIQNKVKDYMSKDNLSLSYQTVEDSLSVMDCREANTVFFIIKPNASQLINYGQVYHSFIKLRNKKMFDYIKFNKIPFNYRLLFLEYLRVLKQQ
jgi:hypothetical protein